MANNINVKVEGVEKAIANIKKWQLAKTQACKDVLWEVGEKVRRDAMEKGKIPIQTGRLRNSITIAKSGDATAKGTPTEPKDAINPPTGPPGLVVAVGSNVKYAHMQEFGSWGGGPKPGKGDYPPKREQDEERRMTRRKGGFLFLTKAYIRNKDSLEKRISQVLKEDITVGGFNPKTHV